MSSPAFPHRTIVHLDLDAFFCAVEELYDESLRGKAFAVGGRTQERGVVASCSYAARAYGVHSAMSMATARRLCPNLIVVPTRHGVYSGVSRDVMKRLHAVTPLVQQISIDEAFLDVTALVNQQLSGRDLAARIQKQILEEMGLSCSVGVASNKMVAKIATDFGKVASRTKNSPLAICVVPPGEEETFLAPLAVSALWGVGPKMAERLNDLGISTIGDLARWPERDLMRRFGRHGYDLSQHARGIDKREIVTERESKSVSSETTFWNDISDWDDLHEVLIKQSGRVAAQLQKHKLQGSTVKVKLRWTDFTTVTRQTTLPTPTSQRELIQNAATALLKELWRNERPVRLLGVGVANINPVRQLSLWEEEPVSEEEVEKCADIEEVAAIEEPVAISEPEVLLSPWQERKQKHLEKAIAILQARFGPSIVRHGNEIESGDVPST